MTHPPGWYTDPADNRQFWWWDGTRWTEQARLPDNGYHPGVAPSPYQTPQWAAQPAPSNGLATAGMVLGILGVVIEWAGVLTLAAGILALVFGMVGVSRANKLGGLHSGRAVAGIILGCIAILAYLFWGILTLGLFWFI